MAQGQVPDGVEVHLLPFPDVSAVDGEAPHETTFQKMMSEKPDDEDVAVAAVRFMTEEYLRFPTLGGAQRAVRQVISLLADGRPVIAHCFAGKDSTGFTVATVLDAQSVSTATRSWPISCAATRRCRSCGNASWSRSATDPRHPKMVTFAEARLTDEVLGVREDYLDAARRVDRGELRLAERVPRGGGCDGRGCRAGAHGAAGIVLTSNENVVLGVG